MSKVKVYEEGVGPMTDSLASLAKERLALEQALKELDRKEARLKREAEEWVSAEEAKALIEIYASTEGGRFLRQEDVFLRVARTLVALRPEPDNRSEYFLTWETPKDEDSNFPADQFSVSLDRHNVEVLLNDDYEQVAHSLTPREAELLGRRLLAASDRAHQLIKEES